MNEFHLDKKANLTISAIPVPIGQATRNFGVLRIDNGGRLLEFQEKPEQPAEMPGRPGYCLASMGNYTFDPSTLVRVLEKDAGKTLSLREEVLSDPERRTTRDFGYDVIPDMIRNNNVRIFVYDFTSNMVPGAVEGERGFWRDVGNIDEFYSTNMAMRDTVPPLNLYNPKWTVLTFIEQPQPAKARNGAIDSIVANGVIIGESDIKRSVISYGVDIGDNSTVADSILLGYAKIGRNVTIKNSIVDRQTLDNKLIIPDGTVMGVDKDHDRARGFTVSDGGITVVPRKHIF